MVALVSHNEDLTHCVCGLLKENDQCNQDVTVMLSTCMLRKPRRILGVSSNKNATLKTNVPFQIERKSQKMENKEVDNISKNQKLVWKETEHCFIGGIMRKFTWYFFHPLFVPQIHFRSMVLSIWFIWLHACIFPTMSTLWQIRSSSYNVWSYQSSDECLHVRPSE